ncbi:MAG: (deoxy)nucleoside triphosphate pyrophosphohydrolase [Pseudomonadota bacterium]
MHHILVPILALYKPDQDEILLSIRPAGKQLAGYYEFPGGKVEMGETATEALCREAFEELDITLEEANLQKVTFANFRFEEKTYTLLMYFCDAFEGEPIGKEGQVIEFVPREKLCDYKMPKMNIELIGPLEDYIYNYNKTLMHTA